MKSRIALSFWLAAASLVLAGTRKSPAQDNNSFDSSAQGRSQVTQGQSQATQMVPAQAALATNLDAKKMQPGTQFQAVLDQTIRFGNGTELPHGTRLIGTVTTDSMASMGKSSLALRFTQAELKDGKVIPIKATITDIQQAQPIDHTLDAQFSVTPWDGKTMVVDEVGALSHIDLHSRIAGDNSAVFVSTKKDDVRLLAGSQMELAISPAQG